MGEYSCLGVKASEEKSERERWGSEERRKERVSQPRLGNFDSQPKQEGERVKLHGSVSQRHVRERESSKVEVETGKQINRKRYETK